MFSWNFLCFGLYLLPFVLLLGKCLKTPEQCLAPHSLDFQCCFIQAKPSSPIL